MNFIQLHPVHLSLLDDNNMDQMSKLTAGGKKAHSGNSTWSTCHTIGNVQFYLDKFMGFFDIVRKWASSSLFIFEHSPSKSEEDLAYFYASITSNRSLSMEEILYCEANRTWRLLASFRHCRNSDDWTATAKNALSKECPRTKCPSVPDSHIYIYYTGKDEK